MVRGVCDSCRLVYGDNSVKEVEYCGVCRANVCSKCKWSTTRLKAFLKAKGLTR